ncbi:hypothetical protein JHK82_020368 [Glycine max]|nr:hypothetical protein JHK87_020266 [Glycine soja]KAG5014686.1 hypothetical protein JHK85_020822 [Glycine max]KAG5024470.1 hypothetical protein JHK86_020384 [Glycine max]KAG5135637.1 hypothetical protein JHK82_020368 [Glycine max]
MRRGTTKFNTWLVFGYKTNIPSALMIYLRYGLIHLSMIISDMIVSDLNFIICYICALYSLEYCLLCIFLLINHMVFLSFQWRASE